MLINKSAYTSQELGMYERKENRIDGHWNCKDGHFRNFTKN